MLAPIVGPVASAHFFVDADADASIVASAPQPFVGVDGGLRLETMLAANAPTPSKVAGMLRVERPGGAVEGYLVRALPGPVPAAPSGAASPAQQAADDAPTLPFALLLAVAAG